MVFGLDLIIMFDLIYLDSYCAFAVKSYLFTYTNYMHTNYRTRMYIGICKLTDYIAVLVFLPVYFRKSCQICLLVSFFAASCHFIVFGL